MPQVQSGYCQRTPNKPRYIEALCLRRSLKWHGGGINELVTSHILWSLRVTPLVNWGVISILLNTLDRARSILWSLCDIPGLPHVNYGAGHYDKWHGIAGRQIGLQDGFNNEFCSRQCNDLQIAVCSILNVSSITARTFHNTFARSFFVHLPVRLFFVDWLVGLFICSLVHSFIRLVWRYIYDK